MILGDSQLVMASLAEKETLKGKVQMIYMDPPYGIKFGSNWQVSTRRTTVHDGKQSEISPQPEQIRAFRDTWEVGIHSYLSYLRDRLLLARELLTDSGSVFVQIGEENVHLVRSILDEVFGSRNFTRLISFRTTTGAGSFAGGTNVLSAVANYILWYAKNLEWVKYRPLYREKGAAGQPASMYSWIETADGNRVAHEKGMSGRLFQLADLTSQTTREAQTTVFPVQVRDTAYMPRTGGWKTNKIGMARLAAANRLMPSGAVLRYVRFIDDFPAFPLNNFWEDTITVFGSAKVFVVQTNPRVIQRCMLMATDPGDLVLDPTCGGGTTALVAEQWARRWITIDTSRVALALTRTRLMTSKFAYYILADSPAGIMRQAALDGRSPLGPLPATASDISKGFIYERIPHVTLKSIANNPDIREGMPRDEIDAAVTRHGESELLYDKPFKDENIVRVSGPFTVESLSPHRTLKSADENPDPEPLPAADSERFIERILDNLRKAGVQNTIRNQRLMFERLNSWPGVYIQADADFRENGVAKRAAICIGPEYGTVSGELIREAAKEGSKFADLLIVCGFAFEANVGEEASKLGRLTILKTRMNPDLSMGDELLKKTGAANLFMVFGEPDIVIKEAGKDAYTVEIRGLDIYDPTTGAVKSHDVDDIACWFIDTNYNEEAFFVRHAYFLGAGDPYEKLKRVLKADIDPEIWETLYKTTSRPFKRPETGKIAIKVINHYGDEVLTAHRIS